MLHLSCSRRYEAWLPNITEIAPLSLTGWIRPCPMARQVKTTGLYGRGVHRLDFGFFDQDSCCFQQDQEWDFLFYSWRRIGFRFWLCWKNVAYCLLDLYLCGVKQESDCLCHVGTGSGADSDLQNRIVSWLKKIRVRTPLLHGGVASLTSKRARYSVRQLSFTVCIVLVRPGLQSNSSPTKSEVDALTTAAVWSTFSTFLHLLSRCYWSWQRGWTPWLVTDLNPTLWRMLVSPSTQENIGSDGSSTSSSSFPGSSAKSRILQNFIRQINTETQLWTESCQVKQG